MKTATKTALIAVLLLLSVDLGFAADVITPATKLRGAAKSAAAVKQGLRGKGNDVKTPAKAKIIDINTAAEAELKAVPGIGDSYAAKIIAGRPYANKAQLKSRNIMSVKVYEQVKDMIIAKLPKK